MKKIYLLFVLISVVGYSAFSQCVIDTNVTHNVPGIYPDSATNLPHAIVGTPYSTSIQIVVAATTTYMGLPVTIDSLVITGVTGLPAGYSYSCTPSSCHFPGGGSGCILLYGPAPTVSQIGSYNLTVNYDGYVKLLGSGQVVPQTITSYSIIVDDNTGISSLHSISFNAGQNIPNPSLQFTQIPVVSSTANNNVELKVSDLIGNIVYHKILNLQSGLNLIPVNTSEWVNGVYIYSVNNGLNNVTRRMTVTNK